MRSILLVLLMCCAARADQWVIAPGGYYVLSLDPAGQPILTRSESVSGHLILTGTADPIPPTDDRWGLVELSRRRAIAVADPETSAKLGAAYTALGGQVLAGKVAKDKVKGAVDVFFSLAVGNQSAKWRDWRTATGDAYNAAPLNTAEDAGQGLIDIGAGARQAAGEPAIGDGRFLQFLQWLIEKLPLILELIDRLAPDDAVEAIRDAWEANE